MTGSITIIMAKRQMKKTCQIDHILKLLGKRRKNKKQQKTKNEEIMINETIDAVKRKKGGS